MSTEPQACKKCGRAGMLTAEGICTFSCTPATEYERGFNDAVNQLTAAIQGRLSLSVIDNRDGKRYYSVSEMNINNAFDEVTCEFGHTAFKFDGIDCCKACGLVRPHDGWKRECKGPAKLSLRDEELQPFPCHELLREILNAITERVAAKEEYNANPAVTSERCGKADDALAELLPTFRAALTTK